MQKNVWFFTLGSQKISSAAAKNI